MESGALVRSVFAGPGAGVLREGDVLLTSTGWWWETTGPWRSGFARGRTSGTRRISLKVGATVPVSRPPRGTSQQGQLTLGRARGEGSLVPAHLDRGEVYHVFGGGVREPDPQPLDSGKEWVPAPIAALAKQEPDAERDEVVPAGRRPKQRRGTPVLGRAVGGREGRGRAKDEEPTARRRKPSRPRRASAPLFDLSNGYKVTVDRKDVAWRRGAGRDGDRFVSIGPPGAAVRGAAVARVCVALADGGRLGAMMPSAARSVI